MFVVRKRKRRENVKRSAKVEKVLDGLRYNKQ